MFISVVIGMVEEIWVVEGSGGCVEGRNADDVADASLAF